jgi:hypothetical protein
MKRIVIPLVASLIPLTALPAAAQSWNTPDGRSPTAYVDGLQWQIDSAARDGRISWRQHRWLQRDLDDAKPLAYKAETNTASRWEIDRLDRDVSDINRTINGGGYRGYYRNDNNGYYRNYNNGYYRNYNNGYYDRNYNNGWNNGWWNNGWRH